MADDVKLPEGMEQMLADLRECPGVSADLADRLPAELRSLFAAYHTLVRRTSTAEERVRELEAALADRLEGR